MNIKPRVVPGIVCSDASLCDRETDKASEIFANVCELVFRRGRKHSTSLVNRCTNDYFEQRVRQCRTQAHNERKSLQVVLKDVAYIGHPIIIEFLLVPASEIESNGSCSVNKHIQAYLMEQWIIQFLPKRLVTDAISDMSCLINDINSYCQSSIVNKVLFGGDNTSAVSKLTNLSCICRLTNLRGANLFSTCWFTISINELFDGDTQIDATDFGFRLIGDLSENFNVSEGVHTTTRLKSPRRTYLCSNPCSHIHRKDNVGVCDSKSLGRVLAGSREVLDTIVTSVLELPTAPPNDTIGSFLRCLHSGTMSLPTKRYCEIPLYVDCPNDASDDVSKCKVPESPVVIMSQWAKPTSFFESPPCKLKRMQQDGRPRMDECINQFTSLSVRQRQQQRKQAQANKSSQVEVCAPNTDAAECHFPLVRKSKNSNSFSDLTPHSLSFNPRTGLPLQSSPIPIKQKNTTSFTFDNSIVGNLPDEVHSNDGNGDTSVASSKTTRPTTLALKRRSSRRGRTVSASAVNSSPCGGSLWGGGGGVFIPGTPLPSPFSHQLLINFEESMLNGRIPPAGIVEGFSLSIGASGSFFPAHVKLPVVAYFFQLADDDNTPSPYLGHVDLTGLSNRRGYHVPHKGSIQLTLFNPSHSVVKVFVIQYDLEDMPANSQTFLRQRTVYMPVAEDEDTDDDGSKLPSDLVLCVFKGEVGRLSALSSISASLPVFLRYLVHLRFHTTKSNNLYLHTDIRLIFARNTCEFDPRVATYRMRAFVEGPSNPRFSPKTI